MKSRLVFLLFILSIMLISLTPILFASIGYAFRIYSPYPFYINGKLESPGIYYEGFGETLNVTFNDTQYQSSDSRCLLSGIQLNSTDASSNLPGVISYGKEGNYTYIVLDTSDFFETYLHPIYVKQYYVTVNYNQKIPNPPLLSGWYNNSYLINIHLPIIRNISPGYRYYIYQINVNGVPESYFHVGSPLNVEVLSQYQVFETFINNVTGILNGSVEKLSTGWYPYGDGLNLSSPLYIKEGVRDLVTGNLVGNVTLTKPVVINDSEITQFYLNFTSPTFIKINGTIQNVTGEWLNAGQHFLIVRAYPINQTYRYFSEGNLPDYCIGMYGPLNITDQRVIQYLLSFPVPVNVRLSNGTYMNFASQWINEGLTVQVLPQTVYTDRDEVRYVIPSQNFSAPGNLTYLKQYLLNIQSPIIAKVNGTNSTLSISWINAGTNVTLYKVYYINSTTRMFLLSTNTMGFIMNSPVNLSATYQLQDYVQIYGKYSTNVIYTFKSWEPYGSVIQVPSFVTYDGTLFQLNSTITSLAVRSPINISLTFEPLNITPTPIPPNGNSVSPNTIFIIASVVGIAAIAVLIYAVVTRRGQ